jgi:hypothetical protein
MKQLLVGAFAAVLLQSVAARAEDNATEPNKPQAESPTNPPPAQTLTPGTPETPAAAANWTHNVTVDGLVDAYYAYRVGNTIPQVPSMLRTFDAQTDQFSLAYAELGVGMAADPGGFRIDLGFGPTADLTAQPGPGSEVFKHIQQAYATMKLGPVTIDAGKFVTNAGAEVIEAKNNPNYSRSILFGYAIPFTHTGVRAGVGLTDQLTMQISLVNGWDNVLDNNKYKTLGLSFFYTGSQGTTAALNIYSGPEGAVASEWRHVFDLVVGQAIGDRFNVNLNLDYGRETIAATDVSWYGASLMGKYKVIDQMTVALRLEYFADPDGYRTGAVGGSNFMEGTLTFGFPFGDHSELRLEGRYDNSSAAYFANTSSPNSQVTVQAGFLAWF